MIYLSMDRWGKLCKLCGALMIGLKCPECDKYDTKPRRSKVRDN